MNLTFRCKHVEIADGITSKEPIIPVTLIGSNGLKLNVATILDSGSDFILLPIELAEALGLEFDKANPDSAKVYTGEKITTSFSTIKIEIKKGREKTTVICKCAIQLEKEKQHEHILFGASFFEKFKITFDYPNNKFQIKSSVRRED